MTFIIPNQSKKIVQTNESDISGSLYVTKNIDLRNNGYIKLSHFPIALLTEDDDADFDTADSMAKSANDVYINSKNVFRGTPEISGIWTDTSADTNAPTPAVEDDVIYFNGTEVVSDSNSIFYRSGANAWTIINLSLVAPNQLAVSDNFNSLLVGSSNFVKMVNTSWVVVKTLNLPSYYIVTALETNGNSIYIGTKHIHNGEGKLFTWDGTSTAWNGVYGVDANEILTIRKYGASCVLVTSKGQLLQFNGSSFTTLSNFPTYYDKDSVDFCGSQNDHDKISNRGMYVDKDKIYLNIETRGRYYNQSIINGIWCYTPDTGLNCLTTASYNRLTSKFITTANVNITTNIVTTTNVPVTGTPVKYSTFNGVIGGVSSYKSYYTIKISSTEFKLANTLTDALTGIAVDFLSVTGDYHYFYFYPIYDYGHSLSGDKGSILILPDSLSVSSNGDKIDNILYSSNLILPVKTVLNTTTNLFPNRGYFITPKLNSSNLEDIYNTITIKHRPLKIDENIVIKYRTNERLNVPFGSLDNESNIVGTWVDTNTFTTTIDMTNAEIGDVIEIIGGNGAGCLFHIDSLSYDTGTWTINLDESFIFATASETMYFYVSNFKKLGVITNENTSGIDYLSISLDKNSKFLQLKIEMRGIDVTIEELRVDNKKNI